MRGWWEGHITVCFYPQANILEQVVDLCFLDNIRFVDLSGNRLTSLTGLEDCPGLLELNVSENRITRISKCLLTWCPIHIKGHLVTPYIEI